MLVWSTWFRKFVIVFFVLGLSLALTACSWTADRQAVYEKKAEHDRSLDVPPDLVVPESDNSLDIPAIGSSQNTFSHFSGAQQEQGTKVLTAVSTDSRVIRDGRAQWLEINDSADVVWTQLLAYFRSSGFEIKRSDVRIGFFETEWKENRAKAPTGWFSKVFSKMFNSGLRDKYRVRIEKSTNSLIRVFIAHQGLEEQGKDEYGTGVAHGFWQVRDSDPELEAEMLQYFLVFRGVDEVQAKTMLDVSSLKDRTVLKEEGESVYLNITENFPRSWRRTGLALDRIGLLIEDHNRSEGLYYIKLTEDYWNTHAKTDEGFSFADIFSFEDKNKEVAYILKLSSAGDNTRVLILDRDGNTATDKTSRDLLTQLQRYLR